MFGDNTSTTISVSTGTMVRALLVLLGVFLLWFLRDLVLVVLTSIVIASFVESAVPHFAKIKINRILGIVILYAVALLVLAGLFYLFAPLLITELYNFSNFISDYIPGVSFFFSIQENGIENFLRIIFPIKYEGYVVDLWERSRRKIALWIKGQVVLGLVITVLTYLLLSLLGIEYALLLSIIAGVLELVPYGIIVALIPAFSFSYLSGGISTALMVSGAYLIIHQFEVFLFAPLIIKKIVGLSPIIIILSMLIGFELSGFWGLVLAIPVAIIIMEFLSDIEKDKILARTNR